MFNQRLEWNSLGELVKTTTNGAVALYRYDGLGRWTQHETGSGGSTEHLYDGDHLLLERSPSGAITEYTYYPGIDQPHSLRRDTSAYYYLQDRSGNVRGLMSPAPALANQYVYDPFGNRLEATESVPNPLQYQGRHYDAAAKLYHFRARWYDPLLERFVSEDPIGLAGGINPYTYAGNDPVNRRDPSGLDHDGGICWEWGIGGGPEGTSYWDFQHNGESWHGHQVGRSWRLCQNAPDFPWGYGYGPSGTRTGGTGTPVGKPAAPAKPTAPKVDWRECGLNTGLLAVSVLGDASFFMGGSAAATGVRLYFAGRATAGQLARGQVQKHVARNSARAYGNMRMGADMVTYQGGDAMFGWAAGLVDNMVFSTIDDPFYAILPFGGTYWALRNTWGACRAQY